MTTSRSEDLLVGIIAIALVPLIAGRVIRGIREGRLPLYRTYLRREENEAKFNVLLGVHILTLLLIAFIAADLLLNLGLRNSQ
ncbi:MAG TPA: hypothetical protein VNT77_01360 [Allosphingosinicella sp.]|nr:hypothetical protein [Allosphingosinicella sp.]